LKTYRTLTVNRAAVEVVLDLERTAGAVGYALFGRCEEASPDDHPGVWREVRRGYDELGFGAPARLFRHVVSRVEPIEPTPSVRREVSGTAV
jgi:hypothetical protein